MHRVVAPLCVPFLVLAGFAQTDRPAGRIDGVVQTPGGKPLSGVTVAIYARNAILGPPVTPFTITGQTGEDGAFHVSGIPDGTYAVCPLAPNEDWVSPCNWQAEPLVSVARGQAVAAPGVQLKPAVDLYVRVNDPRSKRSELEGKVPGAHILIGVRTPGGRLVPVPVKATDKNGADHHLSIPADIPLKLVVYSRAFDLSDSGDRAIDKLNGMSTTVSIAAGAKQHKEVINIR